MKIEMGESLIYSWLRHAKECQIVQTNWTTSPKWDLLNEDVLDGLMDKSSEWFYSRGLDVFKQNTLLQLLKQAEIDVMGISFNPDGSRNVYAVDVAFHESGLNYGSKTETAARIVKKCLRAAFCVIGYLGDFEAELIFASPKVNPSTLVVVEESLDCLNDFFKQESPGFNARLLANGDFEERILQPILLTSGGISDTNELFLRSYQLYEMFSAEAARPEATPAVREVVSKTGTASLSEIKVGRFVQMAMSEILENQLIDEDEVERLCDKTYSHQMFGIKFAMLKRLEVGEDPDEASRDQRLYRRYYSKQFYYGDQAYLLTSQWYEKNRPGFEEWLNERVPGFAIDRVS